MRRRLQSVPARVQTQIGHNLGFSMQQPLLQGSARHTHGLGFGFGLGSSLGSIWGRFGIDLGSIWGRFGIDLGSVWDQFGIDLGSVRGRFGVDLVNLGEILGICRNFVRKVYCQER